MDLRYPPMAIGVLMVATLVVTGPLVGVGVVHTQPNIVGSGTATVSEIAVDTSVLRITEGRFGTNVSYLRVPDAKVTVESVTDRPRLLYQVTVSGLGISVTDDKLLFSGDRGMYQLSPSDKAFKLGADAPRQYEGTVTIRVQSFEVDETIYRRNVSIKVVE